MQHRRQGRAGTSGSARHGRAGTSGSARRGRAGGGELAGGEEGRGAGKAAHDDTGGGQGFVSQGKQHSTRGAGRQAGAGQSPTNGRTVTNGRGAGRQVGALLYGEGEGGVGAVVVGRGQRGSAVGADEGHVEGRLRAVSVAGVEDDGGVTEVLAGGGGALNGHKGQAVAAAQAVGVDDGLVGVVGQAGDGRHGRGAGRQCDGHAGERAEGDVVAVRGQEGAADGREGGFCRRVFGNRGAVIARNGGREGGGGALLSQQVHVVAHEGAHGLTGRGQALEGVAADHAHPAVGHEHGGHEGTLGQLRLGLRVVGHDPLAYDGAAVGKVLDHRAAEFS